MQDLNLRPPACRNGHTQHVQTRDVLDAYYLTSKGRFCKVSHSGTSRYEETRYSRGKTVQNGTRQEWSPASRRWPVDNRRTAGRSSFSIRRRDVRCPGRFDRVEGRTSPPTGTIRPERRAPNGRADPGQCPKEKIQRSGKGLETSRKPMGLQRLVLKSFSREVRLNCLHASFRRNPKIHQYFSPLPDR